jgi:selenide,water dikinase
LKPDSGGRLLTGWDHGEDAALWAIDENRVGIMTLDFITPIVDDPELWGRIAAANALSDVFAMGGLPFVALNIVGFPVHCEPLELLESVLKGGQSKVIEAGAVLAGGHSVEDEEPKYGLAVFGEVRRDRIWRVSGARPGDVLVLTKPLGTGLCTTAVKADMAELLDTKPVFDSMARLNDLPRHLDEELHLAVHACTDVTGFGLAGHLLDMLSGNEVDCFIEPGTVPAFPGVLEVADMGLIPAGAYRNRELYSPRIDGLEKLPLKLQDLLFDPQTSGGLLLAAEPETARDLLDLCEGGYAPAARVIGQFREGSGKIRF